MKKLSCLLLLLISVLIAGNYAFGQVDKQHHSMPVLNTAEAAYEAGPSMNENRMWHHAIVMPNGNVALIGGIRKGFISLNNAEIFNPADGTFTTVNMQYTHAAPAVAEMQDGRYLIAGGSSSYGVPQYDESEIFNPSDSSFTSVGDMVRFRANGGSAVLNDGRVVIAGAWWTHNDAHTMGELYDPESQSFTGIGPFTISRARAAVVPASDGDALILGGVRPRGDRENLPVENYDADTGEITVLQQYIIDENENWTINADQVTTEQQKMVNGRYLWKAYSTSGLYTTYRLITVDPQTKAVELFDTDPAIPNSDSVRVIGQPVIDNQNNRAYMLAILSNTDNYTITALTVDLSNGTLTFAANSFEPESYRLNAAPMVLLNDGRIFASGGSVSDNFDAVSNTLFVTPPEPQATSIVPDGQMPEAFTLKQNYPNPFNPETIIGYSLTEPDNVRLEVFNLMGQKIATLIDAYQSAGNHSVSFSAENIASGIYLYRLSTNQFSECRKMVLVK